MSTSDSPAPGSPEWLGSALTALLAAPYIHFPAPPPGMGRLRMGHGPIDLFSTRFNQLFAQNARGHVNGADVDRDGVKDALLAVQSWWSTTGTAQPVRGAVAGEGLPVRCFSRVWEELTGATGRDDPRVDTATQRGGRRRC